MDWIHSWQERETFLEVGSVTKLFKVKQFHTFIRVDPEGKIIYRGSAAEGYHEMVKLLEGRLATL